MLSTTVLNLLFRCLRLGGINPRKFSSRGGYRAGKEGEEKGGDGALVEGWQGEGGMAVEWGVISTVGETGTPVQSQI